MSGSSKTLRGSSSTPPGNGARSPSTFSPNLRRTSPVGRTVDSETDPATVEHVLPQNPTSGWEEDFPPDKWDAYIYRIGNLTLLEGP